MSNRGDERTMSDDWLRAHAQSESRVEHHSPRMQWPVRKTRNELAWYQRVVLRSETEGKRSA